MVLSFRMLKVKTMVNSKKMSRKTLFTTSRLIIDQLNDFFEDNETQIIKDIKMLFNPEVLEFLPSDWKNIKTEDQVENWLKRQLKESDLCLVELKGEKKIIGLLFLYYSKDNSDTLNIGYLLNKQYWGKGYASELLSCLIKKIKEQNNIERILAGVERDNKQSISLLKKCGFKESNLTASGSKSTYYELYTRTEE